MTLIKKIDDWKKYPNALGSEAQAAVLIGEVSASLKETIPDSVAEALKILSIRGSLRDIVAAIQPDEELLLDDEEQHPRLSAPSVHDVVDLAAMSCGLSWAEALTVIVQYLEERKTRLR